MTASVITKGLRWCFGIVLVLAMFTGFGNMPLYRRYYISDIPGFAWSGDFFTNLYVHYVAGAVLLTLSVYLFIVLWTKKRRGHRMTGSGLARAVALFLVLVSGVVMAVKNLPGAAIPFPLVAVMNLGHMGLALAATVLFVLGSILRWPWSTARWPI